MSTQVDQGVLDRLVALEDRFAILNLRAQYCHLLDGERWDELMDLFTEDAVFHGMDRAQGHDEVLAFFKGLVPGVMEVCWHHSFAESIFLDGDRAWGRCKWNAPSVMDGVAYIASGHYDDEFRRCEDGKWRFSSRTISFYYFNPISEGYKAGEVPGIEEHDPYAIIRGSGPER